MPTIKIKKKDVFSIGHSAVKNAVELVKPTYGPAANKVLISKRTHHGFFDDGVQIARDLELEDPFEQAFWREAKSVAISTNDRAGDGTTGSLIMLESILDAIAARPTIVGYKIERELKKALEEAVKQLTGQAVQITTREQLRKVARISFNHEIISKLIADTWFKIGKDGEFTIDRSGTMETFVEMTDGITLQRGYVSPYMVTNPQRMEAVMEKPYILLTDYRLTEAADVIEIMNKMAAKNLFNLVIVCDNIEASALATVLINRQQGKFNVIAVTIPPVENKSAYLEDLAILTGAKVFSEKKGSKLDLVQITDLGRARRFIANYKKSIIVRPGGVKATINKVIADLAAVAKSKADDKTKKEAEKRHAFFTGRVAVINVGAVTEQEEKELRYKVEDAVHATQAAFKGGVVSGAGLALSNIKTSSAILNDALQAPFKQLKLNMGIEQHRALKPGEAINAITGKIGAFMSIGVVDPVDVLTAALESAVSIAALIVTTPGMIVEIPDPVTPPQE